MQSLRGCVRVSSLHPQSKRTSGGLYQRQLHDLWCVLNMSLDAAGIEVSGGRAGGRRIYLDKLTAVASEGMVTGGDCW